MFKMGTAFRKSMDLSQAEAAARGVLEAGKNKLQSANLQVLSPWQSAPVSNLVRGIQPNTNPLTQIGVGGKMSMFK